MKRLVAAFLLFSASAYAQPVQKLTPEVIDSYPLATNPQPTDELMGFQPQNASGRRSVKLTIAQILALVGQVTAPPINTYPTAQGLVTSDLLLGYQPNAAPASRTVSIPISQIIALASTSSVNIPNYPTSSGLSGTDLLLGYQPGNTSGRQTVSVPISQIVALAQTTVSGNIITAGSSVTFGTGQTALIIRKTTPSPTTVTLPSSPTLWQVYTVKDGRGDANINTITVTASAFIDGNTSYPIQLPYQSASFLFDGTYWSKL